MTAVTDVCEMARVETSVAAGTAGVHCLCGTDLRLSGYDGPAVDELFLVNEISSVWRVHVMVRWGVLDVADL